MIVFEIIKHEGAWTVVHKLRALVKKCRIVFIRFDHKKLRIAKSRRHIEISGNTASQETRLQAGILQNPGQHAGGRGFSMGAGDGNDMPLAEHIFREPLRAGTIGKSLA